MKKGAKQRNKGEGAFELNLVPVLDCLIIMLVFMLASGVYITIGAIETSAQAATDDGGGRSVAQTQVDPERAISVELTEARELFLKVTGSEPLDEKFAANEGNFPFSLLGARLAELKSRWPDHKTVNVIGAKSISYQEVVTAMDVSRRSHPNVSLGGF